jgi:hypothetical protein
VEEAYRHRAGFWVGACGEVKGGAGCTRYEMRVRVYVLGHAVGRYVECEVVSSRVGIGFGK